MIIIGKVLRKMWGDIAITFMIAFLVSYVCTPRTIRLARKVGAIDSPKGNSRKIHKRVMPRLGGIAIIAGFIVSTIYLLVVMSIENKINIFGEEVYANQLVGMLAGILVLGVFCFYDDKKGIKPYVKLLGQIIAAVIVVLSGIKMDNIAINYFNTVINEEIILNIITVVWMVVIINAINLIDGLDGLSSGVSLIACISLMMIFIINGSSFLSIILTTALAGAILGFLPYNFNPARTFLGDTGSNFLGFMLSIISIMGTAKTYTAVVIVAPLLVLALPLFDTSFAIIRRIIREKSLKAVFKADRGHLHHKLIDRGYTTKQAVFMLYGLSASLGLFTIIFLESGFWKALSFALLVVAIVAAGYKDIFRVKNKKHGGNNEKGN